jgi:DNA-binding LytR/AlgR family response regulator
LHFSEIDWIEAAGNYAQLWVGTRHYFLRESLQALEERACRFGFLRAHRRALVRLDGVRELVREADGALVAVLGNGARIPLSRRRRAAFVAAVHKLATPASSPEP